MSYNQSGYAPGQPNSNAYNSDPNNQFGGYYQEQFDNQQYQQQNPSFSASVLISGIISPISHQNSWFISDNPQICFHINHHSTQDLTSDMNKFTSQPGNSPHTIAIQLQNYIQDQNQGGYFEASRTPMQDPPQQPPHQQNHHQQPPQDELQPAYPRFQTFNSFPDIPEVFRTANTIVRPNTPYRPFSTSPPMPFQSISPTPTNPGSIPIPSGMQQAQLPVPGKPVVNWTTAPAPAGTKLPPQPNQPYLQPQQNQPYIQPQQNQAYIQPQQQQPPPNRFQQLHQQQQPNQAPNDLLQPPGQHNSQFLQAPQIVNQQPFQPAQVDQTHTNLAEIPDGM
ncbi:hypothetical protein BLNAU_15422 [Blattamonas nauphoetae]|uniref:Uncharacterized protein n=1 Tax=Blattamonas nauphoetae TaxID=2049346 RepID=A0ABQ9XAW7_9EUKA|nr:hypothetical protein BLNAU_15422 [Blattamonas nauphoetae]